MLSVFHILFIFITLVPDSQETVGELGGSNPTPNPSPLTAHPSSFPASGWERGQATVSIQTKML
jgi:hypothetical protein